MALRNTDTGWGWPARILHWGMAGLIIFMIGLGYWTANILTDVYVQFAWVQVHKSWGFVIFVLALARVVWRLVNPTPRPVASGLQEAAAQGAHVALYVLMFAIPLTGWLMSSASPLQDQYGIANEVFGLFEMWDPFVPGDGDLEKSLHAAHFWLSMALAGLLVVHAGAALKHHFVDRDGILRRMVRG